MNATLEQPTIRDMPAEAYHADHASVSKSMLWDFRESRRMYEALYVTKVAPPEKSTSAMDKGTLADAALLEPERLDDLYAIYPESCLGKNGRLGTNAADAFRAEQEAAGKIVIKQQDFDAVLAMVESAKRTFGRWLAMPSDRQKAIHWTNKETGMRCRCRPDWVIPTADLLLCFDMKTTASPAPRDFAKRCASMGYWLQAAHYIEGVQAAYQRPAAFYFVVVESEFPFRSAVQQFSVESMADAEQTRHGLLRQLAECVKAGDFAEPWERTIGIVDLKPWHFE